MPTPTIFHLLAKAHALSQHFNISPSSLLIIALLGALVLLSVLITLLVWLRYLVMLGLVAVPTTMVLRWKSEMLVEGTDRTVAAAVGEVDAVDVFWQITSGDGIGGTVVLNPSRTEKAEPSLIPAEPVD